LERFAEVKLWWQACRLHFSKNLSSAAGTAASTARGLHFLRNAPQNFTEYLSERPEISSHDENSKKAKTTKGNHTYENKIS
jgi:hypothetical protein